MREILGERRTNGDGDGHGEERRQDDARRRAALRYATHWGWPVLPGAGAGPDGLCDCARTGCPVPGAHPDDPALLAATTDPAMVRWWWTTRPGAPVILATGGRAPCALSLPALAGARAVAACERLGVALGPVAATPTRWLLLVEPYGLPELGELLADQEHVPSSLRFHSSGGYVPLPPSRIGAGGVWWAREPGAPRGGDRPPWLPRVGEVLDILVDAGLTAPDQGSRLAY
ncbi:bifunctional DNA primase/polymerase [Streptomyces sp. RFCAC02]|uniref:bifunctional DNA primase/polymerase n=1 Tax=Streptomyces sp. RFCAC02 TaxID=2499143 RepID=UPI001021EA9A|nr:bifunctional DNA primase/polymerase [Streptomyces sp. RFCAC02]